MFCAKVGMMRIAGKIEGCDTCLEVGMKATLRRHEWRRGTHECVRYIAAIS
jgi:hypothetical protein